MHASTSLMPVAPVRADGGGHHARPARQLRQRRVVAAVGDDDRPVDAEVRTRTLELLARAARERDRDAGRRVLGQVAGDEPADEPGRPEDDDVVHARGPYPRRRVWSAGVRSSRRAGTPGRARQPLRPQRAERAGLARPRRRRARQRARRAARAARARRRRRADGRRRLGPHGDRGRGPQPQRGRGGEGRPRGAGPDGGGDRLRGADPVLPGRVLPVPLPAQRRGDRVGPR